MDLGCLNEGMVVAFLDGGMAAADRSVVASHLEACGACADLVTWAAADQQNRSRSAGRERRPFIGLLEPGSRVDRYQILGAVGRGGMGEVYAAYHPDLDRRIALKVVGGAGGDSADRRTRLLREARAIARLSHPNVVSVYDAGTVGDRVYIAMEFVEGETVDEWLESKSPSWSEILDVFIAAGRGLGAAHAAGIIHRDFKPQNVMIGRDGSVRVMDFGLARMAEEPAESAEAAGAIADTPSLPTTVTKTGALVGTLAYMAPEQFHGEKLDARADQFSFCVALHEALYGVRPALAHLVTATDGEVSRPSQASVPTWLRAIVSRGLSDHRDGRFASMDELIRALTGARKRPRRRAIGVGAVLAVLLVAFGGWRAARGARVACGVPADRLSAAWSGHDDELRQSIHRAFTVSGRPTAETSWQRVSRKLDDYVRDWSGMYVDACEATHVRGEQSGEVLDLRMSCLSENLDEVRALTTVLPTADEAAIAHSMTAVQSLTPISRCADLAVLRSAIPMPRDSKTFATVSELRSKLKVAQAMRDVGNFRGALSRAIALRPAVEATGYRPLLAEVLELIGCVGTSRGDPAQTEAVLQQAFLTATEAHDDATAGKAAADLVHLVGFSLHRPKDAETWFRISESTLNRLGSGTERTRAWAANNFASVLAVHGQYERAERLARQAVALKEQALGKDHPDVAISLNVLTDVLNEEGHPADALPFAERGIAILTKNGDPESDVLGSTYNAKGNALISLGRGIEAETAYAAEQRIYQRMYGPLERPMAFPIQGIGEAKVLQGAFAEAIPLLETALRIQEDTQEPLAFNLAETRYWLARALWDSGKDRRRALQLATEAKKVFSAHETPLREKAVVEWLAEHQPRSRRPSRPD